MPKNKPILGILEIGASKWKDKQRKFIVYVKWGKKKLEFHTLKQPPGLLNSFNVELFYEIYLLVDSMQKKWNENTWITSQIHVYTLSMYT